MLTRAQKPGVDPHAVLEALPLFVVVVRRTGLVEYTNRPTGGRAPEDFVGRKAAEILGEQDWPRYKDKLSRALDTGRQQSLSVTRTDAQGRSRRILVFFSPLAGKGKADRVLVAGVDLAGEEKAAVARRDAAERAALLSRREREVLALVAEGFSNSAIAQRLGTSPRTVESHRERVQVKMDLRGTAEMTRFALAAGLLPL